MASEKCILVFVKHLIWHKFLKICIKTILFLIIFLDTAYFEFAILGDVLSIILQNFTKIEDNDTLFLIFKLNYLKSYNIVL
jgi:hypothetical protein